jgi:uncharacterized C2H2 Zn-finger protein
MSNENSNVSVSNSSNVSVDKKRVSFNENVDVNEISEETVVTINPSNSSNNLNDNNKVDYKCNNCNRLFKTENAYNKHVRSQVCISTKDKTYCSTCDKLFQSRDELDNHLLSMEHYECINNLANIKPLKKDNKLYNLDPVLNNNDVDKMNKVDIGTNLTIIYNNDNIIRQEIKINTESVSGISDSTSSIININNNGNCSINSNTEVNAINNTSNVAVESNDDRKKKILDFLINNANTKESSKNFLKLLNKLSIEDYSGLNNCIIKSNDIPVLAKQQYIKTIQTFINLLIKKNTKGESKHNGYNIQEIVTAISK